MKRRAIGTLALASALAFGAAVGVVTSGYAAGEKGTEYTWSMDLDCALCHQAQVESLAADAEETPETKPATDGKAPAATEATEEAERAAEISAYAAMHADTFGLDCADCHEESDGLDAGHKKLNSGKEAKRLKKSEVPNEVCTPCHKVEDLAEKTEDYTGIVDNNGTVVNPHALPEGESHESIRCTDCHEAHSGKSIEETGVGTCISCHHAGVFECNTCH